MENNKQTPAQNGAPVMDIQPPRPIAQAQEQVPAPQDIAGPVEAPAEAQAPSEPPVIDTPEPVAQPPKQHSHRGPIVAVLCAVVVAGVFATVAVLAYLANDPSKTASDSSTQQTTTTQTEPATASDVDDTEKAIDESLSGTDDSADYDEGAVSDTTLAL